LPIFHIKHIIVFVLFVNNNHFILFFTKVKIVRLLVGYQEIPEVFFLNMVDFVIMGISGLFFTLLEIVFIE
jgi:hypothetical protein